MQKTWKTNIFLIAKIVYFFHFKEKYMHKVKTSGYFLVKSSETIPNFTDCIIFLQKARLMFLDEYDIIVYISNW